MYPSRYVCIYRTDRRSGPQARIRIDIPIYLQPRVAIWFHAVGIAFLVDRCARGAMARSAGAEPTALLRYDFKELDMNEDEDMYEDEKVDEAKRELAARQAGVV